MTEKKKGDSLSVGDSECLKRKREEEMVGAYSGIQRYLVTVEYNGTRFLGFQRQKDKRTVQGVLEAAFENFVGHPVASAVSSRTDTGVHALANTCHVDIERRSKRRPGEVMPPFEANVVKRAVNHFIHKDAGDMAVVGVQTVPLDFHARYRAQERTYHYRILAGRGQMSVFQKDQAWHVDEDLNLTAMLEACELLVGHHDFSSFRASGCQAKSPLRTLDELHVCEMPVWPCFPSAEERRRSLLHTKGDVSDLTTASKEPDSRMSFGSSEQLRCFVFTASARSFLYHQVRLLVGTLKAVGCAALTVQDVTRILEARTITCIPAMAPACGLYLADVKYDFTSDNLGEQNVDEMIDQGKIMDVDQFEPTMSVNNLQVYGSMGKCRQNDVSLSIADNYYTIIQLRRCGVLNFLQVAIWTQHQNLSPIGSQVKFK